MGLLLWTSCAQCCRRRGTPHRAGGRSADPPRSSDRQAPAGRHDDTRALDLLDTHGALLARGFGGAGGHAGAARAALQRSSMRRERCWQRWPGGRPSRTGLTTPAAPRDQGNASCAWRAAKPRPRGRPVQLHPAPAAPARSAAGYALMFVSVTTAGVAMSQPAPAHRGRRYTSARRIGGPAGATTSAAPAPRHAVLRGLAACGLVAALAVHHPGIPPVQQGRAPGIRHHARWRRAG